MKLEQLSDKKVKVYETSQINKHQIEEKKQTQIKSGINGFLNKFFRVYFYFNKKNLFLIFTFNFSQAAAEENHKTIEIDDGIESHDFNNKENYLLINDEQVESENHLKTNSSKINIITHYKNKKKSDKQKKKLVENGNK